MLPAEGPVSAKPSEPGKISSAGNKAEQALKAMVRILVWILRPMGEPQKGSGQENELSMYFLRHPLITYGV